jgi:hypothetical protein
MRFGGLAVGATVWTLASWLLFAGCGARTNLEPFEAELRDAGRDSGDASDASPDVEAGPDSPFDATPDVGPDAPPDAPPDASPDVDVPPGCDAGDDSIVLLGETGQLHRFDPETVTTSLVGQLNCATDNFNSMTVSRTGKLYLSSGIGELFIADADTLACEKTPFDASQVNYIRYGMGFTADDVPAGETLFIAPRTTFEEVDRLARIDLDDYELHVVGYFATPLPAAEVKGTSDGRLYLVHMATDTDAARLVEVNKETAVLGESIELPISVDYRAFDFVYWDGAFYVFVTEWDDDQATVIRYTPALGPPGLGLLEVLGTIPVVAVGAGVSTCAPL